MPVFKHLDVSWAGFFVSFGFLLALLFLRRLLPSEQTKRGRWALLLLILSIIFRIGADSTRAMDASTSGFLGFGAVLFLAFGMTGVVTLTLFDIILGRSGLRVPPVVRDVLQALAFAVIVIVVLKDAGVNVVSLITTSAVLTAVIGLALQSTISNLFAGMSLQMDRTITLGDWVQVGDRVGRVAQIKWRSTFLVTRDGDNVIVP